MPDVTWTGGITELKKISTQAESYYIPVSQHDASGPINVLAGAHVMMTTPNFYKLETANADLTKYNEFIETPLSSQLREQSSPAPEVRSVTAPSWHVDTKYQLQSEFEWQPQ